MGVHGVPRCVVSLRWGQIDSVRGPPDLMVPLPPLPQSLLPRLAFLPLAFSRLVSVGEINVHFASSVLYLWTSLPPLPLPRKIERQVNEGGTLSLLFCFLYERTATRVLSHGVLVSSNLLTFAWTYAVFFLPSFSFFFTYLYRKGLRLWKPQTVIWLCLRVRKSMSMHVGVDERLVPTLFFSQCALQMTHTCWKSVSGENLILYRVLYIIYEILQARFICRLGQR